MNIYDYMIKYELSYALSESEKSTYAPKSRMALGNASPNPTCERSRRPHKKQTIRDWLANILPVLTQNIRWRPGRVCRMFASADIDTSSIPGFSRLSPPPRGFSHGAPAKLLPPLRESSGAN